MAITSYYVVLILPVLTFDIEALPGIMGTTANGAKHHLTTGEGHAEPTPGLQILYTIHHDNIMSLCYLMLPRCMLNN